MNNIEKSIIQKYEDELKEDTTITRFDLLDKQMRLPAIKHKWVARLINHKQNLSRLKIAKDLAKEKIINELQESSDVILSKVALDKMADKTKLIEDINKRITTEELVILYLEKVEVIFKSLSYDVTNMVELIKLEEM